MLLSVNAQFQYQLLMQREKAQRDWEALLEDEDSFRIPIGVRIEDSLDTSGLETASLHEAIPAWNKGFQMLQRMGWKGQGLGREENGPFSRKYLSPVSSSGHLKASPFLPPLERFASHYLAR